VRRSAETYGFPGALVLAAALALAPAGCGREEADSKESAPEISVRVAQPTQRDLPRTIRVTGTLHGDEETTIAAKVEGRVVEVLKDMGDSVAAGESVIRIDATDYELARTERQRAFTEALARLGLEELPEGDLDVSKLPAVESARHQADNARARYERAKGLVNREQALISAQDFADVRTEWEVAQSQLQVEKLRAESTLAEARMLEAQVGIADQKVLDTNHRAPEAVSEADAALEVGAATGGMPGSEPLHMARVYEVAERMVTVGDFVQVGTPLVRLVDADPLKLRAAVPERRLGSVAKDQPVQVSTEASEHTSEGHVSRVSPAVDTRTRTFSVEILVANPERKLKPGSFATADIVVGNERAMVVPAAAVITFAGVHKVALVRENKIEERRVELGDPVGDDVEIRSGLTLEDTYVVNPSGALTTGTPVTISEAASQPLASARD